MSPAFLAALLDTLLPGEPPLPRGSAVGLDLRAVMEAYQPVFDAIAARVGGADSFASASEAERIAALKEIERTMPDTFRALLAAILTEYYDGDAALTAMGWRTAPPQPTGHAVEPIGETTWQMLEKVKQRGKLWIA
jgi:hypothetical protein